MSNDSFTHLHVHTEFSMLDGAARLPELVAKAAADGQPALGITDHGNMYGVLDFYRECRDKGVKPIIGTEAYMAYDSRLERPSRRGKVDDSGGDTDGGKKLYYHLTLLAESDQGYRNLIQLSSLAFMEGYYYKPRMDWELLEKYHEGLIATTGCLGGHVLQALLRGDEAEALRRAGRLQDIFGRDNLFVELQDHGLQAQRDTNPQLIKLARTINAPIIATNDSHYTHREDHESHDALLCVQTGAMLSDPNRFKFEGHEHYLKSADEMRYLFREFPEACDNTLWIAERADVTIEFGKPQLPNFPIPEGFTDDTSYLHHLCWEGARMRWGDNLPQSAVERLAYELKVIADMGFSSYFLIVWDLIHHAKEVGIRVGPGRGSAAGCAVAYCLKITDLDPIKYDLLFERFLNPSRVSMPDIDMDFDSRYRDEMIRYAAERYGRDHVAQIITFGTIKARNAVRDAARVLGYPYGMGDKIAKAMPPLVMGRDTPLRYCFEQHPKYADGYKAAAELRSMYDLDSEVKKVVDVAKGLEGLKRSDGIHAAAVVITKEPLTTYLPVQRKPEPGGVVEDAPVVTQYEMHGVEDLGLLKMDFLGLRNLDVITDTVEMVRSTLDPEFDIDTVPLDDVKVFELLGRGDTIGVFQLESSPMRALLRAMAPDSFDDVGALIALYRPGPMSANMHYDYADRKNGRQAVSYFHDDAEQLLADTYGLMIYQESVMRVAQQFAGYDLAQADNLRKACLPAGTRMLTATDGYVPIEEVMGLSDRRLQTIDTKTFTSRHDVVDDVWSVGVKPVLRLTTSSGYTIEATADHRFRVGNRWRPLRLIQPGDHVAVAAHARTAGSTLISEAEIDLAAMMVGDAVATVPDGVLNAPQELVERFVGRCFAAVGWADEHGAHYASASREAMAGLKRLLLRTGIIAALADDGERTTLSLIDKAQAKRHTRLVEPWVSPSRAQAMERWLSEWGTWDAETPIGVPSSLLGPDRSGQPGPSPAVRHRHALAGMAPSGRLEQLRTGDLVWDTVVSIEPVGDRECFDFQMADGERPYALADDVLVHNCGKKVRELMAKERAGFVAGCEATGYGEALGTQLFDVIERFADYAFNKSHSYGYGLVTYQTAYLKAHYPVEYLACLLTSVKANLDKAAVYLSDARASAIVVQIPDVNRSRRDFAPVEGERAITFGMSAVRNVGEALVDLLVAERDANGPFESFHDFAERVPEQVLNKRTVESLIKAGAFDNLGHPRRGLLAVFEQIIDSSVARRRERDQGVMSLFGDWGGGDDTAADFVERIDIPGIEFAKAERLRFEKEMLGLYVSDHPLMGVEAALRRRTESTIAEAVEREDGSPLVLGGVITNLARRFTKKGDQMATFVLEDLGASIEVTLFPRTLAEQGHKLTEDAIVVVRGRLDRRDERVGLMAQEITVMEGLDAGAPALHLHLPAIGLSDEKVAHLKRILREHPGDSVVFLHLSADKVLRLSDEFAVERDRVVGELRVAFGHDAVRL
jgi:DNA-directed DNA polymerase III PolC